MRNSLSHGKFISNKDYLQTKTHNVKNISKPELQGRLKKNLKIDTLDKFFIHYVTSKNLVFTIKTNNEE
jgi:hypothetical protein